MKRILLAWTVLCLVLLAPPVSAGEPRTPDAWVEEALVAAGDNRPELEAVLRHFELLGDGQRLEAARFLVANMVGHGYVLTALKDAEGNTIPYDPLAYETFKESRAAIEALETEHGDLGWDRERVVEDLDVVVSEFLVCHIEGAFAAWEATPTDSRVAFDAFLQYVLPYRGSQEPLDLWVHALRARHAGWWDEAEGDPKALHKRVSKDVHQRVRFNERYYLHPTDQGFSEMLASGQGRCEDLTNMMTFASRSVGLATAADYTPAWAHRDNNHAWNVLLDKNGRGFVKSNAHAAKVYRKTFALQRDGLAFLLEEGEEAPNRFLKSKTFVDVTDQYRETTDVEVTVDPSVAAGHRFAYLCVFNGGRWTAIHWGRVADGRVVFDRCGRDIAYLPAVFADGELKAVDAPLLVLADGTVERLPGEADPTELLVTSVRPKQRSVDTHVETPISYLEEGETYLVQCWTPAGWVTAQETTAGKEPLQIDTLPTDGLYWVVARESRRLERIFTIQKGRQRFW